MELIEEQTNKYAAECMGPETFEKWNVVTVDQLCAYMGFIRLYAIDALRRAQYMHPNGDRRLKASI